jgi:hypothetical protein
VRSGNLMTMKLGLVEALSGRAGSGMPGEVAWKVFLGETTLVAALRVVPGV